MGVKDQALKEYLGDFSRYADLMNGTIFQGKQVVQAAHLVRAPRRKTVFRGIYHEAETTELQKMNSSEEKHAHYLERERDMLMLHHKTGEEFYIACEGESQPDYEMPARNFTYDGIEYSDQIKCKESKQYKGAARPLVPVFHLVLYLGEKRWLSKHTLLEMMAVPEELEEFVGLLPDYKIQIADIHEQDPEMFQTEWKDIFRLMRHSRHKKELKEYVEKNADKIRKLSLDTRRFLAILLDQYEIMDDGNVEVKEMCEAWDGAMLLYKEEGIAEGETKGESKGIAKGIRAFIELCGEFGLPRQDTLIKVQQKFHLSAEAVEEYLEEYYVNS